MKNIIIFVILLIPIAVFSQESPQWAQPVSRVTLQGDTTFIYRCKTEDGKLEIMEWHKATGLQVGQVVKVFISEQGIAIPNPQGNKTVTVHTSYINDINPGPTGGTGAIYYSKEPIIYSTRQ